MTRNFVITLTAANRVGILAAVSNALAELGGDLTEIRQTVVTKFFTMIIAAEFPEHREPQVVLDHIRDVCRPYAVDVTLKEPEQESLQADPVVGQHFWLTMNGCNEPEVMRRVSKRLARSGIDICNMHASSNSLGDGFRFVMEIAVPPGTDLLELQDELTAIGDVEPIQVLLSTIDDDSAIYQRTSLFLQELELED